VETYFTGQIRKTVVSQSSSVAVFPFVSISVSSSTAVAGIVVTALIDDFLIGVDSSKELFKSGNCTWIFLGNRKRVRRFNADSRRPGKSRPEKIHRRDEAGGWGANWYQTRVGTSYVGAFLGLASERKRFLRSRRCGLRVEKR